MIEDNFNRVKKLISAYEIKYGRGKDSVKLLAVSKGQPSEKIAALYHCGQIQFGENYLQEALIKKDELANLIPDNLIEWHFIGPIQSNKTKKIAEHFAWVHSVDQFKIAKRLNDQRPSNLPPLNVCIEVNVSEEGTKSGVKMDEVKSLIEYCSSLPHLKVRGLMAIPKIQEKFRDQCMEFQQLFLLQQALINQNFSLDTLSMGMSHDFEAAIAEGATIVRIGTLIFAPQQVQG